MDQETAKAREIILKYGRNPVTYQIINEGIKKLILPDSKNLIGYVENHGVTVLAGPPVGDPKTLPQSLDETNQIFDNPCYFAAGKEFFDYVRLPNNKHIVEIGSQPVWNPKLWSEKMISHSSMRYQLNRAKNKGVTVREISPHEAQHDERLRSVLTTWLDSKGLPPLHFLVEPETLGFLDDRRTFIAEQNNEIVAWLNLCPIPLKNGWLTEQFPRFPHAPNGSVELLMDYAARTLAKENYDYLTMGMVPLSSHCNRAHDPAWLKFILGWVRAHGRRFYNFGGLESFKSKFNPDNWEVLYAVTPKTPFNPKHLIAIGQAFTQVPLGRALTSAGIKAIKQELRWLTKPKG